MGAGILSGITGNRADGVVWDDLIKGREQADSDIIRNKTWDAYFDDLLTRKKPNAWEIGVTTRWHEDDPAGRILPENYNGESGFIKCRDGNDWFVVCIPAEAESRKSVRAQSFRGYIAQHGLYCPFNAPWFPAFRAELMSFPAGRNDDQIDMLGLLGQLLDKIMAGKNPVTKDKPKRDRWDRAFDRKFAEDDGWSDAVSWKVA